MIAFCVIYIDFYYRDVLPGNPLSRSSALPKLADMSAVKEKTVYWLIYSHADLKALKKKKKKVFNLFLKIRSLGFFLGK